MIAFPGKGSAQYKRQSTAYSPSVHRAGSKLLAGTGSGSLAVIPGDAGVIKLRAGTGMIVIPAQAGIYCAA
jgi:hypothetical protein